MADTCVSDGLCDLNNTSCDVSADQGYRSLEREAHLKHEDRRVYIQRRRPATEVISDTQNRHNHAIATPRSLGEHAFVA